MSASDDPLAFLDPAAEDATLAAAVAEHAGFALPEGCVPGVAANARLLRDHWAVVQAALA